MGVITAAELDSISQDVAESYWRDRRARVGDRPIGFTDGYNLSRKLSEAVSRRVAQAAREPGGLRAGAAHAWPFRVTPSSASDEVGDAVETVSTFETPSNFGAFAFLLLSVVIAWVNAGREAGARLLWWLRLRR